MKQMKILLDADGCPVVDLSLKIAKSYNLECLIFCDTAHQIKREGAKTITVETGADSVDFALVNMVQQGDIVVTQDYGLAAMCLARQAIPISQDGMVYTNENIESLLLARHTAKKIRMSGGRLKGPAKRTPAQDKLFEQKLNAVIKERRI